MASGINAEICQQASEWLVRNRENDLDDEARKSFDLWLRASPQHIRAYLELSAVWEDLALVPDDGLQASDLIAQARLAKNVVSWTGPAAPASERPAVPDTQWTEQPSEPAHRVSRRLLLVASLFVAFTAAALLAWTRHHTTYSTAVGEQRSITLTDGSTIELNAQSRIRVHFTDRQREVELLEGQALFHVAKDSTRPFVVGAERARVRAVGTQFDVYRKRTATIVTVLEGKVAIKSESARARRDSELRPGGASPILLSAGQQLTVTSDRVTESRPADLAAAMAWTQHRIVFTDASLTEVAEEFNRYNARELVIEGGLESFRISGVFSSADPELLLRFLRNQNDIAVEEKGTTIRISRR